MKNMTKKWINIEEQKVNKSTKQKYMKKWIHEQKINTVNEQNMNEWTKIEWMKKN